ncbi:MAG: hypothetical protein ACRDJM_03920, partial [Actinomycetota bacterium]
TAHNSTRAFDYLLLRKGLRPTPGAPLRFVVAMEDVATPAVHSVRAEALRAMSAASSRPVAAADFGALSVFELAPPRG